MRHFILEQLLEYSEQAISNLALQWNFIEFINQFLRVIDLKVQLIKKLNITMIQELRDILKDIVRRKSYLPYYWYNLK